MAKDPEDIGAELAETLDTEALYEEAGGETREDLLPEILTSFRIQLQENQNHAQHELLQSALYSHLESPQTDPETITKDEVLELARDFAREAFHEYANVITGDDPKIRYTDLPDEEPPEDAETDYFAFNEKIVDGFWEAAQDTIQLYVKHS